MILRVTQILDRAKQGVTRPFVCIADDGHTYYVKGSGAGWGSLVAEWVAGSLARLLDLPVAEFRLIEVDDAVLRYAMPEYTDALGAGIWFGSRRVEQSENLTWSDLTSVPLPLQARVLLFDWWVANGDRTLTPQGGNVNLLWTAQDRRLHIIDHNQAFEAHDLAAYMETHVFRKAATAWTRAFHDEHTVLLARVTAELEHIWSEIPSEWTTEDCPLTFDSVRELLWRFETDPASFWHLP